MNGNTYLVGADAVERAATSIQKAAESLDRAASSISEAAEKFRRAGADIDFSLSNHQRFLNDWLDRARQLLEDAPFNEGEAIPVYVTNADVEVPPTVEVKIPSTIPAPAEPDYPQEGPID